MDDNYVWPHHDGIQRALDHIVVRKHDERYDLTKIPDQHRMVNRRQESLSMQQGWAKKTRSYTLEAGTDTPYRASQRDDYIRIVLQDNLNKTRSVIDSI